jgi:hypothetical protein
VIFADIFTSYAKVLGDVWLSLCMLLPRGSLLYPPKQYGWYRWILPTLMRYALVVIPSLDVHRSIWSSLPYLVRLRQCVVEYTSPSNDSRRPLWNALKYASSFPVIFLSAAQRLVLSDLIAIKGEEVMEEAWHGEHALFRLWCVWSVASLPHSDLICSNGRILAALVNTSYSFWWDVTNDWGFDLLQFKSEPKRPRQTSLPRSLVLPAMRERSETIKSPRNSMTSQPPPPSQHPVSSHPPRLGVHPWGLRARLLYPLPVYPLALFLNLILRLTWSIKLSSHLHAKAQGEGSLLIFWVEVAELLRRWMWVFIRVEWEIVKRSEDSAKHTTVSSESLSEVDRGPESIELTSTGIDEPSLRERHA